MNTEFTAVLDWPDVANAGAGVAVADLNADGVADLVVLRVDDLPGGNAGHYRVGLCIDDDLTVGAWSDWVEVPAWDQWFNEGAGVAIADISGNGQPDLLVLRIDGVPDGPNTASYRIGWNLDAAARVTDWSEWFPIPDWFPWANAGADVTVADVDGDGVLDLVLLMVDAPGGRNQGYYRSAPLKVDGTVMNWRDWTQVPDWYFWENQGAGIAVADLDADGTPEIVVFAVDNPREQNGGYYSLAGGCRTAGRWMAGDRGSRCRNGASGRARTRQPRSPGSGRRACPTLWC